MTTNIDKKRTLDMILNNVCCYLCLEQFKDPRLLNCNHTFCKKCLDGYIETVCTDGVIDCPLCKSQMAVPERGARELDKNYFFHIQRQEIGAVCSICGDEETARAHCIECDQDYCDSCLKSHAGMTATREHHMLSASRSRNAGKIIRNVYCKSHTEEKLMYRCTECKELVCQHCNVTTHKHHSSKYVSDVSVESRKKLKEVTESDEYINFLCWLAERKEDFSQELKRCKTCEHNAVDGIEQQAELLHQLVDAAKNEMLVRAKKESKERVKPLKENINEIDRITLSAAVLFLYARNICKQGDDIAVVSNSHKLRTKLDKIKSDISIPPVQRSGRFYFEPRNVEVSEVISSNFGEVKVGIPKTNDNKSEFLHAFEIENQESTISSILPLEDGRAWVVEGTEGVIQLYDTSGRIHKTLRLGVPVDDIVKGPDDTIFVSCNSGKEIKAVDKKLQLSSLLSTPYCVRGLSLDVTTNSLFICMTEKNAFFDHDDTHNNKVVKTMTGKGKRWELPEILEFSSHPTVEYPARTVVTKNSFVAISDWKRECVTILNKTGHIETEYFGLRKNTEQYFCPRGLCYDESKGLIFVADFNNSKIMKIDETGQVFDTVLSKADGIMKPWSLALGPDGSLWVGSQHGKVAIYLLNV